MGIDNLISGITGNVQGIISTAKEKPITTAAIGAGGIGAVAVGTALVVKAKKKSKTKKKTTKKKRKTYKRKKVKKKNGRRKKGRRTPRTAGKGKDRSTRRIRYTKKGQPYVILRSGKARFIKKKSAKRSHKLKGGRY